MCWNIKPVKISFTCSSPLAHNVPARHSEAPGVAGAGLWACVCQPFPQGAWLPYWRMVLGHPDQGAGRGPQWTELGKAITHIQLLGDPDGPRTVRPETSGAPSVSPGCSHPPARLDGQ